jgi:nitroreductase
MEPGPTHAQVKSLLTIAARVPDHGKLAPWRFLVFRGDARLRAGEVIARVFANDHPEADAERVLIERNRLARAPMVIAVISRAGPHPKIPEREQLLSAGAACMNLVIAANAMGFATSWLTEWFAYDDRVRARFGLKVAETVAGFIHIGTARTRPSDRVRPVVEDITDYFEGEP